MRNQDGIMHTCFCMCLECHRQYILTPPRRQQLRASLPTSEDTSPSTVSVYVLDPPSPKGSVDFCDLQTAHLADHIHQLAPLPPSTTDVPNSHTISSSRWHSSMSPTAYQHHDQHRQSHSDPTTDSHWFERQSLPSSSSQEDWAFQFPSRTHAHSVDQISSTLLPSISMTRRLSSNSTQASKVQHVPDHRLVVYFCKVETLLIFFFPSSQLAIVYT